MERTRLFVCLFCLSLVHLQPTHILYHLTKSRVPFHYSHYYNKVSVLNRLNVQLMLSNTFSVFCYYYYSTLSFTALTPHPKHLAQNLKSQHFIFMHIPKQITLKAGSISTDPCTCHNDQECMHILNSVSFQCFISFTMLSGPKVCTCIQNIHTKKKSSHFRAVVKCTFLYAFGFEKDLHCPCNFRQLQCCNVCF